MTISAFKLKWKTINCDHGCCHQTLGVDEEDRVIVQLSSIHGVLELTQYDYGVIPSIRIQPQKLIEYFLDEDVYWEAHK